MVLVHARHPALTNTLVTRVLAVMSGIRQEISELIFSWQQHPTQKFANRVLHPSLQLQACYTESGIVMVDGCFMVDGPCVNHAEKAVNHVLWLTGFLGRWLTEPCLMSNFELSGHQFGTILKSFILTFQSASI